jgi:hypothetical protein
VKDFGLIGLLGRYYYNPTNFKLVVFDGFGCPLLFALFSRILVNVNVMHLGKRMTRAEAIIPIIDAFHQAPKSCILFATRTGLNIVRVTKSLHCRQVIQLEMGQSDGLICRERMRLVEQAGAHGRFITIQLPYAYSPGGPKTLRKMIVENMVSYE